MDNDTLIQQIARHLNLEPRQETLLIAALEIAARVGAEALPKLIEAIRQRVGGDEA